MKNPVNNEIVNKIKELITPSLDEAGLEIYELEYKSENIGWVVRIYIDKKEGKVNISDCQKVSKSIDILLETSGLISDRYYLEVSSPGLDRNLKTKQDFLRYKGEEVGIYTASPVEGRNDFKGKISDFMDDKVILDCDGKTVKIPVDMIKKAKLDIRVG